MGQKVNPKGFRLAVRRDWESRWFANKGDYATAVNEDYRIREFFVISLRMHLYHAFSLKELDRELE